MCQVHCVIIIVKLNAETQSVIVTSVLPLHGVLVVADVSAASVPATPILLGLNF